MDPLFWTGLTLGGIATGVAAHALARHTATQTGGEGATKSVAIAPLKTQSIADPPVASVGKEPPLSADAGYHRPLDRLPTPVWAYDAEGTVIYGNAAYRDAVGASQKNAAKQENTSLPELDTGIREWRAQVQETGNPVTEDCHIVLRGARRLMRIMLSPGKGEGGHDCYGIAVDIQEQETLTQELTQYVHAQEDLLESSRNAMVIFGPDQRLAGYNQAFVRLWKCNEGWLSGNPSFSEWLDDLRARRRLPEQADFRAFQEAQRRLFTDLTTPHEEHYYLPDGMALRVVVIPHALGGLLFSYEDVTDRLSLERSFNTLIAVQQATLDHLHEGVAVFGEDGRLRLSNPVFATLWEVPENWLEDGPHLADVLDRTRALYTTDTSGNWEEERRRWIGMLGNRHVEHGQLERPDRTVLNWSRIPLPDGATLFSYSDVTASTLVERSLRERAQALAEADELKTEFLANVSYELRSPLTSILGFTEILQEGYAGALNENQREYIDGVHHAATALVQLIDGVLDLASIQAGYFHLDVKEFPLRSMLRTVHDRVSESAKEAGIRYRQDCPDDIGGMTGDETRLTQVLVHLVNNAIKFTPKDGEVTLSVERLSSEGQESRMLFRVKDNGPGIPEDVQQRVLDPFVKVSRDGAAEYAGTGLGLSLAQKFVTLHDGVLELDSTPGQGTEVRCFIPCIQKTA